MEELRDLLIEEIKKIKYFYIIFMKIINNKNKLRISVCFFFVFLLFNSCEGAKRDSNKEHIKIVKDSLKKEQERWSFFAVSHSSVINLGNNTSREEILKQFKDYKIEILDDNIKITRGNKNICTKSFHIKTKNILSYWNGKENVDIYRNIFNQVNIKLPDQINVVITGANPDDACEYPFGEIIQLEEIIFFVYNDYLVFFKKESQSTVNNNFNEYNSNFYALLSNTQPIALPIVYDDLDKFHWNEINYEFIENMNLFLRLPDTNNFIVAILLNDNGDDEIYRLITIKNDMIIDSKDIGYTIDNYPESDYREIVLFSIDKNFLITLFFKEINQDKLILKTTKKFKINDSGKFVEVNK